MYSFSAAKYGVILPCFRSRSYITSVSLFSHQTSILCPVTSILDAFRAELVVRIGFLLFVSTTTNVLYSAIDEDRILAGEIFPPLDYNVAILRIELHHSAFAPQLFACDHRRAGTAEYVEHGLSRLAGI